MSVDQLPRPASRPNDDAKFVEYDAYIDRQIQSTRRAVKAVDIATALVTFVAGVLAYLLAIAIIEHWLLPSGFSVLGRSVLFAVLVGGAGYFVYRRLWPLIVHSINPVFAAHTIEQSSPTLKNSLINLLLFRGRRGEISDAVFKTLEEQAAHRLTRVPVDAAVDRSQLIRLGYVLLAIVAIAAAYKVFSPKDPITTVERVLLPWADIVPASRVQISSIEPGSVTVARGELLDISADVRGIGESDPVLLRYTTADGQAVGKPIAMKATDDGVRFATRLPDAPDSTGAIGVGQNFSYRIEAGDARSLEYRVIVVPAPSILVDRVDYDYPDYTGYQDRSVEQLGDIRAIEGTKITIHARANGPIDEAMVDFDADGRRDLTMRIDGARARAELVLALREDRETPRHSSYVLRFTNREGRTNRDPVKHPIDVLRDYAPEVVILAPQEKTRDVRLNETVTIEVEARDPDFALGEVLLKSEAPGRPAIDERLLSKEHTGRFTARYEFTPSAHDLRAGDVVQLWAVANDVRSPEPNSASTDRKIFRIVSPDPNRQPPPDRVAQRDQQPTPGEAGDGQQEQEGQQGQNGIAESQDSGNSGGQDPHDHNASENQQPPEGDPQGERNDDRSADGRNHEGSRDAQPNADESQQNGDEQQPPDDAASRDGQSSVQEGEQNQSQQNQGEQNQPQSQQQSGQDQGGEKQSGGESSQGDNPASAGGQSGEQSQAGTDGGNSSNQSNEQNANGKQTGAGAAGGERSNNGSQPADARPDGESGDQLENQANQRSGDSKSGNPQGGAPESSPISSEGDNDAEAFERISQHLKKNGELSDDSESGGDEKQSQDSASSETDGGSTRGADRDEQQGGSPPSEANQKGEKQPDGEQQGNEQQGNEQQGGEQLGNQPQSDPKASEPQSAEGQREQQQDAAEGTGAETRPGDMPDDAPPAEESGEEQRSPGGQQTGSKGESGAGDQPDNNQGVPNSDEQTKPSQKWQQRPAGDEQKPDEAEPPAGARGKRESDSQGEQGGDKPGGGEEGGGQKAPRDGTGSAGQNQSADEGAGESSERGQGNDSPDAGTEEVADRRTGQPGTDTPGEGSTKREVSNRDQEGANADQNQQRGSQPDGKKKQPGDSASSDDRKNGEGEAKSADNQQSHDGENSFTPGGNQPASPNGENAPQPGSARPHAGEGTVPDGDDANLEYARKQTDLVLEKLAEQLKRKKVDQELLDKLGWTQEELDQFVARWQQRKQAARANDPGADSARREFDDALRSLGLRPGQLQQGKVSDDNQRDLSQGYRGAVPLEYQERLRAYNQGVSRSRQDAE